MTPDVVARFVIRRRPYVAKAIDWHWQRGYQWGHGDHECILTRPASGESGGVDKDTIAKVYGLLISLYKHWLGTMLKYNAAYYLITGAMVSLYLTRGLSSFTGFYLVLPLAIGIGLVSYARDVVAVITNAEKDVAELKAKLDAKKVPDMGYVVELLQWSIRWFVIVVIGLGLIVFVCFIKTGTFRWLFNIFPNR